jgi:triosephosphate isomerase
MKMFIANWKMNLTFQQELLFFQDHLEELKTLKNKLIVCPSFPALAPLFALLKDTDVGLAAQDCSEFESGPFTGQVSAASLVQIGCSYVVVGHPDQRAAGTTPEQVAQKALRVLEAGMIPLIFVGESSLAPGRDLI